MIDKYNAFISYRHSLQDNKIAKEVQTQLEHFRIPHKIRKATGKKRIDRIFRDKEELPITSDLNEDIDFALAHSDYLIVLCSTHTSESIWVQKEIETFLKNHSKKEILTVLVDGEPEEVIPDILMHDTVTRTLNDGSVVTYEEVIEPLSCDYRLPIKTARKEELPRIAASIIGCSYDELMRRRRQYRIRRALIATAIAAVVSIGVMTYLTWSLTQIQTNYDKALISQSENYAAQSELALDDRDKVSAIKLALQGLPSEENPDMPVTDEAWKALSDALGVYWAPGLNACDTVWKYEMESSIKEFTVSDDQRYIAALDSSNNIRVWEAVTHKTIADICFPGEAIRGFGFAGQDTFVVLSSTKITGYDISDWEVSWTTEVNSNYGVIENSINAMPETDIFTAIIDDGAVIVDAKDGKVLKKISCDDLNTNYFSSVKVSKDGKLVAITCADSEAFDLGSFVYIYDLEKDSFTKLDGTFYLVTAGRFTPDGDYVVMFVNDQEDYSMRLGSVMVLAESTTYIQKFDHKSGQLMWAAQANYTAPSEAKRLVIWNYKKTDGSLIEVLVALYSDRCTIINNETGDVIKTIELPAQYVSCYSSGENTLLVLLYNGQYCRVELSDDSNTISASAYFDDRICQSDLVCATNGGGVGFITRRLGDNYLIEYNLYPYDENFEAFDKPGSDAYVQDSCMAGDYFITYDSDDMLIAYDVETGDLEWSEQVGSASYFEVELIGTSSDGEKLYLLDDSMDLDSKEDKGAKLIAVDVESGDMEVVYTYKGQHAVSYTMNAGYICVAAFDAYEGKGYIFIYEIEEDDMTLYQPEFDLDYYTSPELYLSPDGKHLIVRFVNNTFSTIMLADLEEDEYDYLGEAINGYLCYAWNEDSTAYACGTTGLITVYEPDGEEIMTIDTNGRNPMALQYYNGELLVVYSVGVLARYDSEGNLLSEAYLDCFAIETSDEISFVFGEETFVVTVDLYSTLFSLETFKPRSAIYDLMAYDPNKDIFVCKGYIEGDPVFGTFKNLTIEELIELGKEYITVEQDD